MYVKTLVPGGPLGPMACLVATVDSDAAVEQLHQIAGWARLDGPPTRDMASAITVPAGGGLTLSVGGLPILQDSVDPAAPPGWWSAVDALGGVIVLVCPPGSVDLHDPQLGGALRALLAEARGVWAIVPVNHGRGI